MYTSPSSRVTASSEMVKSQAARNSSAQTAAGPPREAFLMAAAAETRERGVRKWLRSASDARAHWAPLPRGRGHTGTAQRTGAEAASAAQ
jgi:hypothetical protein